jgi:hypothetical protein
MYILRISLFICAFIAFVGCGLADIPARNRAIEEENMRVYDIYRSYMRSMNEQREKSGINPEPIRSYEEWKRSPGTQ